MLDNLSRRLGMHSLKQRLRFWVGSIIVFLGILVLITTYFAEAHSRTVETNQQLRNIISLQRLFIERWLSDHSAQIKYLASSVTPASSQEEIRKNFLSFMSTQDEFAAVVYLDAKGKVVVDTAGPSASGSDLSGRQYFKEAQQGRSFITDIMVTKNAGTSVVIVSSPVQDTAGQFNGLVFGAIKTDVFGKLMSQFESNDADETYLLGQTGKFITSPLGIQNLQADATVNDSPILRQAQEQIISDAPYENYAGKKVIGQYGWTKDGQWLIIAEKNYEGVFKSLFNNMLVMVIIILGVTILSFILLTILLTKGVERPLRLLLEGTKIMRDGNYDYRISMNTVKAAPTEIQELCDTFNATSQKLSSTIQMLEQTAVVDQLTELYNRRFILNEGLMVLETCIRGGQPCSVLMIDIDFFKKVNDTYGHLVGDRVIIFAASILMACIRNCDMVSRYGGEEFLILSPNTEADPGAVVLGERIRRHFEDNPYREDGLTVNLTVSIGAADYRKQPSYGKTVLEDMISRADQALYLAKNKGRNRVELLPEEAIIHSEDKGASQ